MIVTATGLQLQALGGITVSIDGAEIKPNDRFSYKEYLLEDVPNVAWCIGYTNASWTLRADMTARVVGKAAGVHGLSRLYPRLPAPRRQADAGEADVRPAVGLRATGAHVLPKSGTRRPWIVRHNYVLDVIDHRFDRIEESMVFGRASGRGGQVRVGGCS